MCQGCFCVKVLIFKIVLRDVYFRLYFYVMNEEVDGYIERLNNLDYDRQNWGLSFYCLILVQR